MTIFNLRGIALLIFSLYFSYYKQRIKQCEPICISLKIDLCMAAQQDTNVARRAVFRQGFHHGSENALHKASWVIFDLSTSSSPSASLQRLCFFKLGSLGTSASSNH